MDDNGDYRPGLQAVAELHVVSPLRYVGLYKEEIRQLSKELQAGKRKKRIFFRRFCLTLTIPSVII